jgi:hypothetical protein
MTVTDELPRRPRRKLVTPLTASLTAVLIAALGFLGGVQVQKSAADSGSPVGAGRFTGARLSPQGGSSDATVGTVANVNGHTLYVTDASGNTIRVKTNGNSKVTRTAVSKAAAVHPGDTVIVRGTKSNSGTVTATAVTATAKNATGGVAGLLGAAGAPPAQEGSSR